VRGTGGSSRIVAAVVAELVRLLQPMQSDTEAMIPVLVENSGVIAAVAALERQKETWRRVLGPSLKGLAGRWIRMTSERDRLNLQKSLAKALGVPAIAIFDEPAVQNAVDLMGMEAVHLISSIPDMYHDKVLSAVMKSYQQQPLPEGRDLIAEIREIGKIELNERAKLIAVDQTNKMHCMVTQARQTSLGIEEYIWRTAEDQRVVGNPSGLYPKGSRLHMNHFEREGVKFRWDSPPPDGHPGWPIRCRCHAEPVITDYSRLNLQ
jgi:uncharacterized protein with gpF-like domain